MRYKLEDILRILSHDALSFMASGSDSNGSIMPKEINKTTSRVNSVLRRLGSTFVLKESTVRIRLEKDQKTYKLEASNPFIVIDPGNPFLDDVAQILRVEDADGKIRGLDDLARNDSIMVRDNGTSLRVSEVILNRGGELTVTYKARTPQFEVTENLAQEIEFPEELINALSQGVAAMTYSGMGGSENVQISNGFWSSFNVEVNLVKSSSGGEDEEITTINKLKSKGFC